MPEVSLANKPLRNLSLLLFCTNATHRKHYDSCWIRIVVKRILTCVRRDQLLFVLMTSCVFVSLSKWVGLQSVNSLNLSTNSGLLLKVAYQFSASRYMGTSLVPLKLLNINYDSDYSVVLVQIFLLWPFLKKIKARL